MSRLPRLSPGDLPPASKALLEAGRAMMGFMPNDALDMARNPDLLEGVSAMVASVYGPGRLDPGLKRLIGHVASAAAGCVYCQQHTAHGALGSGEDADRVAHAWEYETHPAFSEAERAALRLAHLGSLSPSQVGDADFEAAREHHSDDEMVEIVAVIAMFGFLNRWNAVMRTDIEPAPAAAFASIGAVSR